MNNCARIERRLKLHELRVLMTVVEAGSMGRAAERLGTSQPAVSRAIADLEHTLGVPLLDRNSKGIAPTQFGLTVIKRGVAVFDELRQAIRDVEFIADPTTGQLRFGCPESMAGTIVYSVIDRLTRRYPRISFQVVTGAGPPLFEELRTRNVEFLISRTTEQAAEEFSERERLFDDAYVVAASRNSRWARRRNIDLGELLKEPWVTAQAIDGFGSTLLAEAFRARGMRAPRPTIETVSVNLRNRLLATGRFLTMIPGYSIAPNSYPFLKKLPVAFTGRYAPVAIWTLKNRTLSPPAVLFIETLRTVAKTIASRIGSQSQPERRPGA